MDNQDTTYSQQLVRHIKIRNLQGPWRRISNLSLTELEQLWNETAHEIREGKGLEEPNNF